MSTQVQPSSAARGPGARRGDPSIPTLLAGAEPSISFEFFPPKDDASEAQLWEAIRRLEKLAPSFVSVTYGAGGTTRDRTVRVTERIARDSTLLPMAHLTCVGSSVAELRQVIGQYAAAGIRNVLALRGDPPGGPGAPWTAHPQGLNHADDLVRLLVELGDFTVGVAAFPDKHPESASLRSDAEVLQRKADAGASFAVSQMVFDASAWARLRDELVAIGCDLPVVPGVMPVTNVAQLSRMAELSGTPLPAEVVSRLAAVAHDPKAVRAVGVEIATEICEQLLAEGAPGLHFYTMNRSTASMRVYRNLGLTPRRRPVAPMGQRIELSAEPAPEGQPVVLRDLGELEFRDPALTAQVRDILVSSWGNMEMIVDEQAYDLSTLPTIVAMDGDDVVGVLTYAVVGGTPDSPDTIVVVSCDARTVGQGVGRALAEEIIGRAQALGARRVRATTRNDNLGGLGFWQAMGFTLTALRPGAVIAARALKPIIPVTGYRGLPIRDEIDLELLLG